MQADPAGRPHDSRNSEPHHDPDDGRRQLPVPGWLRTYNTREGLRDAMLAVLKTPEIAGIDVVADGELCRWDINHPETNGMIDYFVRPLQGVQVELTLDQLRARRQNSGMAYRSQPAGIVTGPLGHGRLNLVRDYALDRDLTRKITRGVQR